MEARFFRRIGTVYVGICCSVLAVTAIVYFQNLAARYEEFCVDSCEHGVVNLVLLSICTIVCVLSTFVVVFVQVGIRDKAPGYITFNKIFMLVRNCVLSVRWIYEIIELTIYHIHGDAQGDTGNEVTINAVLIVLVVAVITPLELYLLNGIKRNTKQRLRESEDIKTCFSNGGGTVCVELQPMDVKS